MTIAGVLRAARELNRGIAFTEFLVLILAGLTLVDVQSASANTSPFVVKINRAAKRLSLVRADGVVLLSAPVGIGKGGLARKVSMEDLVTPTGRFVVNLVLANDPSRCSISNELKNRYSSGGKYGELLTSKAGLVRMFENMNSLDFDGDGKADIAYGGGYIGLGLSARGATCAQIDGAAVLGPGARTYSGKVSWYSIALHGTPNDEASVGKAVSGGCIHVEASVLRKLLKLISVGTPVEIFDD